MNSLNFIILKSFIIAFFTFYSLANSEQCRKYKCGNLTNNICLQLNYTIDNDEVTGDLCDNRDLICQYSNFVNDQVSCEVPKNIKPLQYPGGMCASNQDCINGGQCKDITCQGKALGEVCSDSSECFYGNACYINNFYNSTTQTCNKLKDHATECNSEYECGMNQGCFNGKCTYYFSLPDGAKTKPNKYDNQYSFCSSGHEYNGVCDKLSNLNNFNQTIDDLVPCDEANPCKYKSNQSNEIIVMNNVCKCGKSPDGKRYCPIYGGNSKFAYALKQMKTLVNTGKSQCNTLERGVNCNSQLFSNKNDKSVLSFNSLNIKLNYYHLFANAEDCIQKIYFPDYQKAYDPDPVNPEGKCPIYRCNSADNTNNKTCASNIYNKDGNKFYVDLFSKSCNFNNEICNFDRTFVKEENKNSQCQQKEANTGKRYPGEPCQNDSECFIKDGKKIDGLGECKNNLCSGFGEEKACQDNYQCLSGYFCKRTVIDNVQSSTCSPQVKQEGHCDSMFDCENNLLCANKRCSPFYYTAPTGSRIPFDSYSLDDNDKNYLNYICESGRAISDYTKLSFCVEERSLNQTTSDLVPCNLNQNCAYLLTDNKEFQVTEYKECSCGFNSKGQGYCPTSFSAINVSPLWKELTRLNKKLLDNKCHTMNRFDCHLTDKTSLLTLRKKTTELHLYHDSVSCAGEVLSGKKLNISIFISLLIISALIFG